MFTSSVAKVCIGSDIKLFGLAYMLPQSEQKIANLKHEMKKKGSLLRQDFL